MTERIAIVDGVRTPFCKGGGLFKDLDADDLGAYVVKEIVARTGISLDEIDHLIFGNVLQPPHATNIARVLAVKAGLPVRVPAVTVNRNCASGAQAITDAYDAIRLQQGEVIIAGGCESMSNFPILFNKKMRNFLQAYSKVRGWKQTLEVLSTFRPSFLMPEIIEIADPLCGLTMGQTAENLAREFQITREEQDAFALMSQQRSSKAIENGILAQETMAVPLPPKFDTMQLNDDGPRANQTLEALAKLKPCFDKLTGTVTAGTSSQITDGAAAVLMMTESKAKALGYQPLGYIRGYAYAGLDPSRMGLGPVFAVSKLLAQTQLKLSDFELVEINEAFAVQVLACERAFASDSFAQSQLGLKAAIGTLDRERLNVNGGAISLGHPLGASGTRLILTLLKELNRRKLNLGLASMCVGGGQGGAIAVEVK
jgi:acetyl-CoA acyltransferase